MAVRAADLDLPTGRQRLPHLARHQTAHAQTNTEERGIRAALAWSLGKSLAGADHGLAGRILLEPTRQLGVLDVLEEALEFVFILRLEGDGEVSKADDLQAVAVDVPLHLGDRLGFDLVGVGRDAEQGPAVADDMRGDV